MLNEYLHAKRVVELQAELKNLEKEIGTHLLRSETGVRLKTIPGFGLICSGELAGEIGDVDRFHQESSLALYLGMAVLDTALTHQEATIL